MVNKLPLLRFYYKNYRGEQGYRTVQDPKWRFGYTEFHKEPQWLVEAYDIDKQDIRTFAAKDIVEIL